MQFFVSNNVYQMNATQQMDEQTLCEGCCKGDNTARKELYDRYAGRLLAVCQRYAGDRPTAEDLMHDSFLKIYGVMDRFSYRGPGSLRAWMERVTVNVALEWLRSRKKLTTRTLDEGRALPEMAEPEPSTVEHIPRDVLLGFVSELPDGYRTVFNLFCIDGYSHRDIAEMLGINEKSSSSQLFRARAMLARRVKEYVEKNGL